MSEDLEKMRTVADYQFGIGAGETLLPDDTVIEYSKNTGRPRHLELGGALLANYRPNDGLFTLTIAGARRLTESMNSFNYTVTILNDVVEVVELGRNVFAKHVIDAGGVIRPGDEVVVLDQSRQVIAVGKSLMTRLEMLSFKTGVAVKVRRGRRRHR